MNEEHGTMRLTLAGNWKLANRLPAPDSVLAELAEGSGVQLVVFDTPGLSGWDSGLLVFLARLSDACRHPEISIDHE
jgi:phospholipid/cholesterol/gamma-HCH transport system permease protein